jgi:hypothetical protein
MSMRLCAAFLLLISNGCFWGTDFEKMGPEVGIHFDSDLDGGPTGDSVAWLRMSVWIANSADSILEPKTGFTLEVHQVESNNPNDLMSVLPTLSAGDTGAIQWTARAFHSIPEFQNLGLGGILNDSLVRLRFRVLEVRNAEGLAELNRQKQQRAAAYAVDEFKAYIQLYRPDLEGIPLAPFVLKEQFNEAASELQFGDSIRFKYLLLTLEGRPLEGDWSDAGIKGLRIGPSAQFPEAFFEGLMQMKAGEQGMILLPFTHCTAEPPESWKTYGLGPFENLVYKVSIAAKHSN